MLNYLHPLKFGFQVSFLSFVCFIKQESFRSQYQHIIIIITVIIIIIMIVVMITTTATVTNFVGFRHEDLILRNSRRFGLPYCDIMLNNVIVFTRWTCNIYWNDWITWIWADKELSFIYGIHSASCHTAWGTDAVLN